MYKSSKFSMNLYYTSYIDFTLVGVLQCEKSCLGVIIMPEKMLSVEDIAEELAVNPETVRVWIRTGELVALSIGRGYRISRADLDDFIRRRRTDYQKRRVENEEV